MELWIVRFAYMEDLINGAEFLSVLDRQFLHIMRSINLYSVWHIALAVYAHPFIKTKQKVWVANILDFPGHC